MGPESQQQQLRTEMSLPEILAYYGKQLDSAGWRPIDGRDSLVTGDWTNPSTGQQVSISVKRMPAQSGCYEISLRATARRSGK